MRLLRLRLRNFRGVESREVRFAPIGVTLVAGPNEIGKSSLVEALDLLLSFRDDSMAREVRAVQPIGRDVATEIELEAECGAYALVYRKQFHKNRSTELEIRRPRAERLRGREAHDRVTAILGESCDLDLWQALRVTQGSGLEPPGLGRSFSLAQALDAAAGGSATGGSEESLFAAAEAAHGAFFTKTGKPRDALERAEREEATARDALAQAVKRLQALDAEVEHAARLDDEIAAERRALPALLDRVEATRREAEAAGARIAERDRRAADVRAALDAQRAAEAAERARAEFVRACDERRDAHQHCERARQEITPALELARHAYDAAQADARDAAAHLAERIRARDASRAAADRARTARELARLVAVRDELDQARKEDAAAERFLATTRIDGERLQAIRDAERAVFAARAQVDVTAPQLTFRAIAAGPVAIDGVPEDLGAGDERRLTITKAVSIEVPGRLALTVHGGSGGSAAAGRLAAAERTLAERLREAGVASASDAEREDAARRDALRRRDDFARRLRERLGGEGGSVAALEERIAALSRRLGGSDGPEAGDADALAAAAAGAEAHVVEADRARLDHETRRDAARQAAERLERDAVRHTESVGNAARELERAEEALRRARETATDEAVAERARSAREHARAAASALAALERRLADDDPDGARRRAEVAETSLADSRKRRERLEHDRAVLQGRLEIESEQGLHAARAEAEAHAARAQRVAAGLRRRAAAARRLLEALSAARTEARRAYAAPLRERIERLGRHVFGRDLAIELDDELRIATRVRDGVPLPYDSLSGGAKEQLALLARVAAAELTARDTESATPLPLLLDDALGYTDARRLEELGAVLAIAGRRLQVVILTCQPERWRHVGGAHEVRF